MTLAEARAKAQAAETELARVVAEARVTKAAATKATKAVEAAWAKVAEVRCEGEGGVGPEREGSMPKRYTIEKHVPTMPPEFRVVLLGATDSLEEAETVYQCTYRVVRHDVTVPHTLRDRVCQVER
jgi:hypothetical protein